MQENGADTVEIDRNKWTYNLNKWFMRDYAKTGGSKGLPARLDSQRRLLARFDSIESRRVDARREYRTASSFRSRVYSIVKKIPEGKTLTYRQVAEKAGSPNAYRTVGNILNKNYDPEIPCHRVIRSDGKTGGYNRGAEVKKRILEKESKK